MTEITDLQMQTIAEMFEAPLRARHLQQLNAREHRIRALEKLRPVWAEGWTKDSIAAQASAAALADLWATLEATSQTRAVQKLEKLVADSAEMLAALEAANSTLSTPDDYHSSLGAPITCQMQAALAKAKGET
jgi:hypothetical protein